MFFVVMLVLTCNLAGEQKTERLWWFNGDVFVCQADRGLTVLASLMST